MITALIVFVAVFLFGLVVYAVIRVTDRDEERDPFAQAALTVTPVDGFADLGPMPAEIAHDEYAVVGIPASLRYRYGTLGDDGPAPFEKDLLRAQAERAFEEAGMTAVPIEAPAAATCPAPPPVTTPLAKAVQAVAELKEMPADDYLATLDGATAYADDRPFTDWERDSIVMPAIRGL